MRRVKLVLASGLLAVGLFGGGAPARSATCVYELQQTCALVGRVVCAVVAKGRPCIY